MSVMYGESATDFRTMTTRLRRGYGGQARRARRTATSTKGWMIRRLHRWALIRKTRFDSQNRATSDIRRFSPERHSSTGSGQVDGVPYGVSRVVTRFRREWPPAVAQLWRGRPCHSSSSSRSQPRKGRTDVAVGVSPRNRAPHSTQPRMGRKRFHARSAMSRTVINPFERGQ